MTITTPKNQGACVTEMVGKVADQAALSSILYTFYEMHLPLLLVEFLGDNGK
jgi:hypothetical protein